MSTIRVTEAGRGEHWLLGGETTTVKVSGRDTAGDLLVLETFVPPGGGAPGLARHEFVETFYVIEGDFEFGTMDADGEPSTVPATAGDTVFVPSMAWHRYENVGGAPGRLLTIFPTDAIEDLARAIGQKIDDPENPPATGGPPSEEGIRRATEILQKGRIEVMQPDDA